MPIGLIIGLMMILMDALNGLELESKGRDTRWFGIVIGDGDLDYGSVV